MLMQRCSIAALTIACSTVMTRAQADELDAGLNQTPPWTIRLEPMVWAPALRGDVGLPGGSTLDLETVEADENEIIPAGRATLRFDDWSVMFRGFAFGLDTTATASNGFALGSGAIAAGDRVSTELDLAGFDLTLGYTIWTPIDRPQDEVRLAFDLFAGARLHSLDLSIAEAAGGAESSADNTWFEPIGGVRLALDLPYRFALGVSLDAGGFSTGDDSSFSWDITVGFTWRPIENVGLEIGFRHLQMDLSDGEGAREFEFDGALAGLFGAIVIQF